VCCDITFYRDDIGLKAEAPEVHETRYPIRHQRQAPVVLVDDVLFTGARSARRWTP
jgi:pyrimidine operon attenuation protein/uracil phosphoribosyltransferase